jgi:hypothetical protein
MALRRCDLSTSGLDGAALKRSFGATVNVFIACVCVELANALRGAKWRRWCRRYIRLQVVGGSSPCSVPVGHSNCAIALKAAVSRCAGVGLAVRSPVCQWMSPPLHRSDLPNPSTGISPPPRVLPPSSSLLRLFSIH